jgi:flagellar protein FlaJ
VRRIAKKTRKITAAVSTAVALGLVIVLVILQPSALSTFSNEVMLTAILIVITPPAVLDYLNQRWIEGIEDQMPVLVRGISEVQETGVIFVKALEKVVDGKMVRPPLSTEVKKLTVQMSWGLSFEDALKRFKKRIDSSIVNRFCTLVLEASRSGGQVRKVFTATSGFMEEMREVDRETTSQMRPYLVIVYAAFFVFVSTSIILLRSFFAPLEAYPQILSPLSMVGVTGFKDFFYRTMLISALAGGLMAGKIGERRVVGGLKHSIVMMVVGYVLFYILIPPNWMGR